MKLCMSRFRFAVAVVFVMLAMAGCKQQPESTSPGRASSGLAETPSDNGVQPAGEAAKEAPRVIPTISAVELTQMLNKNQQAQNRYIGKVLRIDGIVKSVDLHPPGTDSGIAKVELLGVTYDPDNDKHWTILCTLIDKQGANKLGSGQKVILQGTFEDSLASVQMVLIDKTTVVTAGPVAITQAEMDRFRKEEPQAIATLEKLGVNCGKHPSGISDYEVRLTDEQLTANGQIKPEVLTPLSRLVGLRALKLHDTRISDEGLAGLKKLIHLQTLNVYRTKISDAGLANLKDVHGLRHLELSTSFSGSSLVTDAGLAHLKGMVALESIELARAPVTDVGLASLAGLQNLTFLRLPETQITGTGLEHLKGLRKLAELDLSGCPVLDTGLEPLGMLPKLDVLDLSGTKVGNAGMESLAKSPSLRILTLRNTAVGDAGLVRLSGLKTLKLLTLSRKSKATAEGIKKLKAARPGLAVGLED